MATRSYLLRLLRSASHALATGALSHCVASHSAANTASSGAFLRQCRSLLQMQTRLEVGDNSGAKCVLWQGSALIQRQRSDCSEIVFDKNAGVRVNKQGEPIGTHEEEGLLEAIGDSDAGSGSELEECEWEADDDEAEDVEFLEDLESLDSDLEDREEPTEPRERRKSNGRAPDYSMRIEAPIDEIYALLHSRGFITVKQKRPTPNDSVLGQEDHRIISWYRRVSVGLLNYYSCCDNFLKVKAIVNYQLRWSAIHTLSKKHKSSSRQVIQKYGKNLVVNRDGKTVASFLSVEEIKKHPKGFLEIDPVPPETLIDVLYTRMKRRSREEKKHS